MRDVRYALRVLGKNPVFTATAVLTLALGIGMNTAIFSIFDAMALRPVKLPGSTPALTIYQDMRGDFRRDMIGGPSLFSFPEYVDYRDNNHVFSAVTAYMPEFHALADADVTPVHGQLAACNYFSTLGVTPARGRGFAPNECTAPGAGPVVVISDAFWRGHFGADPHVLGRTVKLNRVPLTIIGVAPASFAGTEIVASSFWVPLSMQWSLWGHTEPTPFAVRENLAWLTLIGRLRPGVTIDQARADLAVIAGRRDAEYKDRFTTVSLGEPSYFGDSEKHRVILAIGTVFLVAVGLVLLIACANVANLFLARAATRQREIAVRLAIGASRAQIIRQLLVESLLIAFAGGLLGTALSFSAARALVAVLLASPGIEPFTISVAPDLRVFSYALLLVLAAVLVFGLLPALQSTRPDVNSALKEGSQVGASRSRLRGTLVGIQVAVSMVLLVSAGLLLRGLSHAQSADPGFLTANVTTITFDLHAEGYTPARAVAFQHELSAWLGTLPGVVATSHATAAPLAGRHYVTTFSSPGGAQDKQMEYNRVSRGFFASVGIPIVRGRDFAPTEADGNYVIVSEAGARTLWPGQDPIGRTVHGEHNYTVVGVARDAQVSELGRPHEPFVYIAASDSDALDIGTIIVRSAGPQPAIASTLHAAVLAMDRDLHLSVAPLRDNMRSYVEASQFLAAISGTLAGLALLLASLGIYGTVAFMVARRTREIGIRIALGARATSVVAYMAAQTMRTVLIGAGIGLVLCLGVTRVLERVLFGVSPLDAVAWIGVPAFLIGVALVASYLPARRAASVDPLVALRAE
jgi:putative ABC transport system permease protein